MKPMQKKSIRHCLILLFWLAVWQLTSRCLGKPILLVGPWETVLALGRLVGTAVFWRAVASTLGRIALGFFLAFGCGLLLGMLGFFLPVVGELLKPLVTLTKTVPVASFVILALIWVGADNLALVISFFVVFPILYVNTVTGLGKADPQLLEMARVYEIRPLQKLWQIYRPALTPHLLSGCQVALGMSWKSGIAAEVIGTPDYSIGEKLYMAKIYFSTDELFAWTATVILLSILFERVILRLLNRVTRVSP